MNSVPLIPRRLFFGNPDRRAVTVSPDSSYLSWLAPLDGVLNVWVAPLRDPSDARAVTADKGRGIGSYQWAANGTHLLYSQDSGGDENWHVYSVTVDTGAVIDLTPFPGVAAAIFAASPSYPSEVVVGINNRDPQWHDVYRVDVVTGERALLYENSRFTDISVDADFQVRFGGQMNESGGVDFYDIADGSLWTTVPPEDALTTGIRSFSKSGDAVYMVDSRDRDKSALYEVNIASGEKRLIAEDALADAAEVLFHPTERHPQAVAFTYQRLRWEIVDPAVAEDFAYLATLVDGEASVSSRSLDDSFWIVTCIVDDGPVRFYLYDRAAKTAAFLFSNRSALNDKPLAKMRPFVVQSRDGLNLVGYYMLPVGTDSDGDGIPDQPLPLVFLPHGGPWYRDEWIFSVWQQWLANRGYAVMTINFRASTGFGKAFVNAGDREWGGKIIDDQVDAVRWTTERGIADPARIGIMGGSFGGYSTLAGLAFHPDLYACGVDLVGIANLTTWIESIPEYWKPVLAMLYARVGDLRTDEGRALLADHSPLTHVDRIRKPLLIGQGANDPRVRQAESDQITVAMQAKGLPVTYLLYPDEGHGFARPENSLSFNAAAEIFLARHLGGRAEPISTDCEGASVQVLAGAEEIAGLREALEER